MMKRQINDSICVIRIEHIKGRKEGKTKKYPFRSNERRERWNDASVHRLDVPMFRCLAAVDLR